MNCTLCETPLTTIYFSTKKNIFYECGGCGSILRSQESFLKSDSEKARYETHNNDVNDIRYQNFVSPITNAVKKSFSPEYTLGLDFGAGPGPVITKILEDNHYKVNLYDPFFYPDKSVLEQAYDYIVCCEVIEHFHHPGKEFELLKSLLKPEGKLFCMTDIYTKEKDFENWYYKNDPTHVFFYTPDSLKWIEKELGFKSLSVNNRLIVFENR